MILFWIYWVSRIFVINCICFFLLFKMRLLEISKLHMSLALCCFSVALGQRLWTLFSRQQRVLEEF